MMLVESMEYLAPSGGRLNRMFESEPCLRVIDQPFSTIFKLPAKENALHIDKLLYVCVGTYTGTYDDTDLSGAGAF
jgi:hypothetical protein